MLSVRVIKAVEVVTAGELFVVDERVSVLVGGVASNADALDKSGVMNVVVVMIHSKRMRTNYG